jgi:hypothetical protein
MIYQVEIGEYDNAYIITGGLTGLTEFNPTIILGDDTGVRINVDSKDDDIFTPWIKQSLEFTLIKSSEGQYDDILAGNDNETWGILIENGYLYLSEGYITISDDAKLKFKGTLALESYAEEYKQTSVVQFTFHDRIGTMEDDIFYTNTQFKSVADILACCLNNVVCAETMYLEWPYTLSSSDDPTEILIDVEEFNEQKKIEVLEELLKDFGMQLIVDYEVKGGITLVTSGALVIRSVIDTVKQNVVYWNMALSSFTSTTCGQEFFTYTGSKLASKLKSRYLLDSVTYPLINNDAVQGLERVASAIKAKNQIARKNSAIFRAKFDFKFTYSLGGGRALFVYYCPIAKLSFEEEDCLNAIASLLDYETTISDYDTAQCNSNGYKVSQVWSDGSPSTYSYYPVTHTPIYLNKDQFNESDEIKFKAKVTCYNPAEFGTGVIRINPVILQKSTSTYKIYYSGSWNTLSSMSQLTSHNEYTVSNEQTETNTKTFTVDSDNDDVVLLIVITAGFGETSQSMYVSNIELNAVEETDNIPDSINLTTDLSGDNRKEISIDSKIMNVPDIIGSCYSISYLIKDINNKYPLTIDYRLLSQTLLAHLSDQYGWQYDGDRWNLDGSCKCFPLTESLNIAGQFGLDEKILIFLNGEYDAKRKILKGKWGQVIVIEETPSLSTINGTGSVNSIISTGANSIVRYEDVTNYGMAYCLTEGGVYTKQSKGTALASNSFAVDITGLTEGALYYYKAYIEVDGVTYYGNTLSDTTVELYILTTLTCPDSTGTGTIDIDPIKSYYEYGDEVTLLATTDDTFVEWKKNNVFYSNSEEIVITITEDVTYCAKFLDI